MCYADNENKRRRKLYEWLHYWNAWSDEKYGNQNSVSHLNIHVKRSYLWTSGTQWCRQDNDHADAAGTDSSTSGEVEIFGKPIHGNEKEILPRIGCLIESPGFIPIWQERKTWKFCRPAGLKSPQYIKMLWSCQPALPGQEIIFAIFSRYEAAFSYCIGRHAQSRTVDFGWTDQRPWPHRYCRGARFYPGIVRCHRKTILISSHILSEISCWLMMLELSTTVICWRKKA